jgi:hypothetical protein
MSIAPGTRLGPYSITAAIGAGGMGEVGKRFLVEQITTAASGRLNFVTEWFEELKRRAPAKK